MRNIISKELLWTHCSGVFQVWKETSCFGFVAEALTDDPDGEAQDIVDAINGSRGDTVTLEIARTIDGAYIGTVGAAKFLVEERGIVPELAPNSIKEADHPCSIGFCVDEQKWYGWSHRAICGFGIGDIVDGPDHCCAQSGWTQEYLAEHPEADLSLPVGFEAKTVDDAKRMAITFADSVG